MGYRRFEDLPVWNDAIELAAGLLRISQAGELNGVGDLKNQLERATISVSNNIAEGYERGTNEELITFLYYARGSAGEVRSMLHLLGRLPHFEELASRIDDLRLRTESISRQLGGWIEAIKNSSYKGHRSQNHQTRAAAQAIRRRDQFLEKVRGIQDEAIQRQRFAPARIRLRVRRNIGIPNDEAEPPRAGPIGRRSAPSVSNFRMPSSSIGPSSGPPHSGIRALSFAPRSPFSAIRARIFLIRNPRSMAGLVSSRSLPGMKRKPRGSIDPGNAQPRTRHDP